MKKKELLQMRRLKATSQMVQTAQQDIPQKVTADTCSWPFQDTIRKYQLYLRCRVEAGILRVALYYPDNLRADGRLPSYEVFLDRDAQRFITYDCLNGKWLEAKLDRLNWPHRVSMYPSTWISASDEKAAATYLHSDERGYTAILHYQMKLRREAQERRNKKETDKWDAELALTPALPKDWEHWVDKVGIPENYLFYEYQKRGAKTGYCTYCGKDVPIKSIPHHNKMGRCACCRHEVTYKAIGKLGWHLDTEEVCVYLIQPWPNGVLVREFWAGRRYLKARLKTPQIYCTERWRVIYGADLTRRTYYWGVYKQHMLRWISGFPSSSWMGVNCIFNSHGDKPGRIYGKTLPHLKAALSKTGLLEWVYGHHMVANPNLYLSIRASNPLLEQLWKAGLPRLADEYMCHSGAVYGLVQDDQATVLTKALGIDRQALCRLRQNNGGRDFLCWLQFEKQSGKRIPDDVISWFCEQHISKDNLQFIWGKMSAVQIYNYLQRQMAECQENAQQVVTTWRDYLSMAGQLGIDTNDEIVYRVKLLRQRHDELVLRCRQKEKASQAESVLRKYPQLDQICQELKDKYEYANSAYAVIAPSGVLDIIVEGDVLCHCLRGSDQYWDRITTHESYILFLRRASAPDMPYYTLEVEPDGTVRQKRTKFDRQESDIEDAKKFLVEWQKVISKRLTKRDREKAAVSRVLRKQAFEKLRRDNVIIYTGDLRGQRMVDVLTADLMETAA